MKCLPFEVLKNIGLYLDQKDRKSCSFVCKLWSPPFRALVFQEAVLRTPFQIHSYNSQSSSLKKLTQKFVFGETVTYQMLVEFAKTSPKVHTLTLYTNTMLSIPQAVSVIKTYWLKSLNKINMNTILLAEILPLLNHQIEELTVFYSLLYDKERRFIPMPKLKILHLQEDHRYMAWNLSGKVLNDIHIAYPSLQKLVIREFFMKEEYEKKLVNYQPFPLLKSFYLIDDCIVSSGELRSIRKAFIDLKEFTLLRSSSRHYYKTPRYSQIYLDIATYHPTIQHLDFEYLKTEQPSIFELISKFRHLKSLCLELPKDSHLTLKPKYINLTQALPKISQLKSFELRGKFLVKTSSNCYDFVCEAEKCINSKFKDHAEPSLLCKWCKPFHSNSYCFENDYTTPVGTTREYKGHYFSHAELSWHALYYPDRLSFDAWCRAPHKLTRLHLGSSTLTQSSYCWLARYCPLLEELYVPESNRYPNFVIHLGEKLRLFHLSFNSICNISDPPFICLNDTSYFEFKYGKDFIRTSDARIEAQIGYQASDYARDVIQGNEIAYKAIIYHGLKLECLKVCGHSIPVY